MVFSKIDTLSAEKLEKLEAEFKKKTNIKPFSDFSSNGEKY